MNNESKLKYTAPSVTVSAVDKDDVIRTSNGFSGDWDDELNVP